MNAEELGLGAAVGAVTVHVAAVGVVGGLPPRSRTGPVGLTGRTADREVGSGRTMTGAAAQALLLREKEELVL